jgi:serine/threonine-protein kinase
VGDEELFENKYRIGDLLGEGGMGVVHSAVHVFSGAEVAIKRIPKVIAERSALGDRLMRESKVLALLIQANIVRLLDCGATKDGDIYLIMERVDGDPLRALIQRAAKKNRTLDLGLALHVIAQAAEAMEFAHHKGVFHRDLKPENIMVSKSGHAKVLDFGLAKTPDSGAASGLSPTNPANVLGTPGYMAPEQVRGKPFDGRADIYALGVVLYEAISGRRPYDSQEDESSTVTEIMGHHVFADARPLRELVPECPERVWRVVLKCLAKAPEDRFARMADLARELRVCEEVAASLREAARKDAAVQTPRPSAARREARVTEPMPESFQPGDALPFLTTSFLRSASAPRELRETEPMPASVAARPLLPFRAPPIPERFGKGHTLQLPVLREVSAGPSVPAASRSRALTASGPSFTVEGASFLASSEGGAPAAELASHDMQEAPNERGENESRSGPGFAFEPTWPDATAPIASPPPVEASRPTPPASAPPTKASTMKTPPYFLAPFGGLVLAAFGLVAVMIVRSPRSAAAARPIEQPASVVEPLPSASATVAPAAASAPEAAPFELPPAPVVSAQAAEPAPLEVAVIGWATSVAPALPTSKSTDPPSAPVAKPARRPAPRVASTAPPAAPTFVPLFQLPAGSASGAPRTNSGVKK